MNKVYILLISMLPFCQLFAQPIIELVQFTDESAGQVVSIAHAGDERLFLVDQNGIISIAREDGRLINDPFLDIRDRVQTGGERGLLGLAFHPNYQENGTFFTNYTGQGGATIISKWQVSDDDPDVADSESEKIILIINQPFFNHNGGDLKFGPDGYLYIAMGDGGSGGDPQNFSQNPGSLLGKMLRIDIEDTTGYKIPLDNPFVNDNEVMDEIWALGLRNPWRFSFDAETGDMWIADVGQNAIEEINKAPASSTGGENYGWRCYEGTQPFNTDGCEDQSFYTFPIFEYTHEQGDRSITGGYVYRGFDYPFMYGSYFYADFVSSRFFTLRETEDGLESSILGNLGISQIATFGEDFKSELYVASRSNGLVYRVTDFCQQFQPYLFQADANVLVVELESADWDNENFTVNWYRDDVLVGSGKDSIYYVEESGVYFVVIEQEDGCNLSSESFEVLVTSFHELGDMQSIKVWPNPFDSYFNLESDLEEEIDVLLIDETGRIIDANVIGPMAREIWRVDVPRGFYTLQIVTSRGQLNRRLIRK